jgi:two-component sensor histidine kinase
MHGHRANPGRDDGAGLRRGSSRWTLTRLRSPWASRRFRVSDKDLRYRTLFECVSDGFALVEATRDSRGHLVDYVVLEANPALHRLLGAETSLIGKRYSEIIHHAPPAWLTACEQALAGDPLTFEYHAPRTGRWFEIHLSRIVNDQLAQLVVDISERKRNEHRQAELFDELNHRVKNNLAIVSSMLAMQARAADLPQVRAHLETAVDRIQTIADVHASLYRSGRKDDVDFAAYLQDLCERLGTSVVERERVTIDLYVEPVCLTLDRAVALGVVVNELVTNAAKHAYPAPSRGQISVRLEHPPGGVVLTVGDSGPGLPPEAPKSGLGMRLIRSLCQQMGAAFEVTRRPGATFHIRLPEERLQNASAPDQNRLL